MSINVADLELNEERFITLLRKLIGETRHLQNNPAQNLNPREDAASNHVLEQLKPFSKENGGPLEVQRISYVEGRGNVIIKYPGTTDKVCSFVGSHLDVVPADPATWKRDPFSLTIEGDTLYGRGTTDCLGHIAVLTDLFTTLATVKPVLKHSIVAVFIANEENSTFTGIGVDQLAKECYLDELKNGSLFWIDSADKQPCQGTAGNIQWSIEVTGKLFHSGLPHKGINSIEMTMDVISYIQRRFYADFPQHLKEIEYKFMTSSTLKPTQIKCASGSLNQICPTCTVQGDIRVTPFYDYRAVMKAVEGYIADINADPNVLLAECHGVHGPFSKYVLHQDNDSSKIASKGIAALTWLTGGENGVACNMTSPGYYALLQATKDVLGDVKPYSISGSLPLIRELQELGFDVQISGYGSSSHYHADNECCELTSMKQAYKVLAKVIKILEDKLVQ